MIKYETKILVETDVLFGFWKWQQAVGFISICRCALLARYSWLNFVLN